MTAREIEADRISKEMEAAFEREHSPEQIRLWPAHTWNGKRLDFFKAKLIKIALGEIESDWWLEP
jgi:hypothetical protein